MRNYNGYGTIVKFSGNRRKPFGARIPNGFTEDGKQLYKYLGYYARSEDAAKALANHCINPESDKNTITLLQLYEEWKESKYNFISKSTQDNYNAAWYYFDNLKNKKFISIRTSQLQNIVNNTQKSRSTLEKIRCLAVMLYKYAIENDITNKNYAEFIKLPKSEKKEKEIFSDFEIKTFWDNIALPYVDTILILIFTGLRIEEFLTLTPFSIDLDNDIITGGLKTDAGKDRVIPIHPKIKPLIKKWYDNKDIRLVTRSKSKCISANYYREYIYYPLLEQLKLERKTPHATRHTCASLLSREGANTKAIQMIMGHSDYAFTANEYTHTDITELKKAINKI